MILGSGRAPGKVILFGEHAVVYGRPALAVPVTQVQAEAVVEPGASGAGLTIVAADLGETIAVRNASADHPLAAAARLTLVKFGLDDPDWRVTVRSTIPIASGMGSGAAVSAAIVRALAEAATRDQGSGIRGQGNSRQTSTASFRFRASSFELRASSFQPADISALVYEVEQLHHGTPSGIDNTVVVYGQPVYFVRGQAPQTFTIGRPFTLAIADTGIHSPTKVAVRDVRRAWERAGTRFESLFDRIAMVVEAARSAIAAGEPERLGPLMDENHALLQAISVSSPELDALVAAARSAGALGAKLSGAGRGGNMIALVTEATAPQVAHALRAAGAVNVIVSTVRTSDT
jgi:mevalonate kinase